MNLKIIDVSEHQGDVNFEALKSQGISGAIVRLSLGARDNGEVYRTDLKAFENIKNAINAGLHVGVYHYSYAKTLTDAKNEAKGVVKLLETLKEEGYLLTLPIWFDMEDNHTEGESDHGNASWSKLTEMCLIFCEYLEKHNYYAGIYASESWFRQLGDLSKFDKWVAHWGVPKPLRPCGLWQYTSQEQVEGVQHLNAGVDMNIAFYDYPSIIKDVGLNGFKKLKEKPKEETKEPKLKLEKYDGKIKISILGRTFEIKAKEIEDDNGKD